MSDYDINNNCRVCNRYRYDRHKESCTYYVKESYSEFLERIKKQAEGESK